MIEVLFQSLQGFTHITFKDLFCSDFVNSESHDIASQSCETFHTSPTHYLLIKKLSFVPLLIIDTFF